MLSGILGRPRAENSGPYADMRRACSQRIEIIPGHSHGELTLSVWPATGFELLEALEGIAGSRCRNAHEAEEFELRKSGASLCERKGVRRANSRFGRLAVDVYFDENFEWSCKALITHFSTQLECKFRAVESMDAAHVREE